MDAGVKDPVASEKRRAVHPAAGCDAGRPAGESGFWRHLCSFRALRLEERLLNWFVQRVVYRMEPLGFSLHFTSRIARPERLVLGRNVWKQLARSGGIYIQAVNGVEIGDDTLIALGVKIISSDHLPEDLDRHVAGEPVRIGRRCWLGASCVVLPGVQLGDEVVVGAGAVVTRSFPSRSLIAGVPARLVRVLEPSRDGGPDCGRQVR
ncbi:MAG: acyltransferase [Deltaproteobacteria bacterium]|nr:acyltransferase [Deltaproteobacteria bacterium]